MKAPFSSWLRQRWMLAGLAALTFAWVVVRAQVQSITIDEADTYLVWAIRTEPVQWIAASNNHVVNSLLMRLSVAIFGISHLAVRLPALIGAAVYLTGTVALCIGLTSNTPRQIVVFALVALNPFTLDYLVAARGYGMASGFLIWALYFVLYRWNEISGGTPASTRVRIALSCSLALSFASNFAFAWVCLSVFGAASFALRPKRLQAIAGLCVPGAVITLFLSAYPALTMPREQLWFGTRSLGRVFGSVRDSFISQPNANLLNPWLLPLFHSGRVLLVPAMLAGLTGTLLLLLLLRPRSDREDQRRILICFGVLASTVAMHYVTYRLRGIPLPFERTALFLVPVIVTLLVIASEIHFELRMASLWQFASRVVLVISAVYLISTLRLLWFQQWSWDADARELYDVAAWWAKEEKVESIASSWHFLPSLNFYKAMSGRESLAIVNKDDVRESTANIFALLAGFDEGLIEKQRLKVVWRGPTGAILAVRPRSAFGSLPEREGTPPYASK